MGVGAEDTEQIADLCARYDSTLATGDAAGWLETWRDDGIFASSIGTFSGTQELRQLFGRLRSLGRLKGHTTIIRSMDGDDDTVRLRSEVFQESPRDGVASAIASYSDTLSKDGGVWKFARRGFQELLADHFKQAYARVPPWETGRPQPEFVRLAQAGDIQGAVLDVGCGTGENALYIASLNHRVVGIDVALPAIERAREKAERRGIEVTFLEHDALNLGSLGWSFDTAIECGVFFIFLGDERRRYAESLHGALKPGGTFFMLVVSDHEKHAGPRPVSEEDIRETFRHGWQINYIREARLETRFEEHAREGGARGWLASIRRLPG